MTFLKKEFGIKPEDLPITIKIIDFEKEGSSAAAIAAVRLELLHALDYVKRQLIRQLEKEVDEFFEMANPRLKILFPQFQFGGHCMNNCMADGVKIKTCDISYSDDTTIQGIVAEMRTAEKAHYTIHVLILEWVSQELSRLNNNTSLNIQVYLDSERIIFCAKISMNS